MTEDPEELDRRAFLKDASLVTAALAMGRSMPSLAATDADLSDARWQALVALLTGHGELPPDVVARGHAMLRAAEPNFDRRTATLIGRIDAEGLMDVEAFRKSPLSADPGLMATAIAIISAFYLGHVGKGAASRYVSYEEALMYRATADVTVIPSFSQAAPGYWVGPPKT